MLLMSFPLLVSNRASDQFISTSYKETKIKEINAVVLSRYMLQIETVYKAIKVFILDVAYTRIFVKQVL